MVDTIICQFITAIENCEEDGVTSDDHFRGKCYNRSAPARLVALLLASPFLVYPPQAFEPLVRCRMRLSESISVVQFHQVYRIRVYCKL